MTTNTSNKDIVVTVPTKLWFSWLCEGDLPGDPPEEREEWAFYTSKPSRTSTLGQRVYVVAHGFLRGYGELVATKGRALIRSGPGVACTLFENGKPKPMRGFQGWRYATWGRDEVREWVGGQEGWAAYGLPIKLANDVRALLNLRTDEPLARKVLREASCSGVVANYNDAYRIVKAARTT